MNRYFNTSGPNYPEKHYTLMREQLVKEGVKLVKQEKYFTIWAPRQTGKSTYFLLLKKELEQQAYTVVWMNIENFMGASLQTFLTKLKITFSTGGIKLPDLKNLADFSNFLEQQKNRKLVFIIDEIEGLNPDLFGTFLHSLRNLYHSRQNHCLKSVILIGISNIVGVVEDNASPFNITDNINIPYFNTNETYQLLGQHEIATGQLFHKKVKNKIADITANQPGLVNGFASELVKKCERKSEIGYKDYLEVEDWYLRIAIDKNVANIVNKAKQYRSFVENLLYRQAKVPFQIDREEIKVLSTNGIISEDEEGNVQFKVPLYKKRLYTSFYPYLNGEKSRISQNLWVEEFFLKDKSLNIEKLMNGYKQYVQKRGFSYFREKDEKGNYLSIKEAALGYSFETYITAFLEEAGGKSYLEAHAGLGRTDLIINVKNKEYIIEFKIYYSANKFKNGQKQLAYYCKKMGLSEGSYLVFVANTVRQPQFVNEKPIMIDGIKINTFLIPYDEQKDF